MVKVDRDISLYLYQGDAIEIFSGQVPEYLKHLT